MLLIEKYLENERDTGYSVQLLWTCCYMYNIFYQIYEIMMQTYTRIETFHNRINQDLPEEEIDERDKHAKLIGQLK